MDNKVIYIKLKNNANAAERIGYFEESYEKEVEKKGNLKNHNYYNFPKKENIEKSFLKHLVDGNDYYFFALVYDEEEENEIEKAFLGIGTYNKLYKSIQIKTLYKNKDCPTVLNLRNISNLDLVTDFTDGYYFVDESEYVAQQIAFIINEPYVYEGEEQEYGRIASEAELHILAQRNEYCRRQYNIRKPSQNRGEFQRDYERIIHSKAFRRMVDKAQIFTASKGDHYRTRMTHSQAVSQIAKGIAAELGLNLNLTDAIALGHDIGHTPFGHQGERTLDDVLRGKGNIIRNFDIYPDSFGGFKHSYQSVRVASILEEDYIEANGMDLSYQTLEGMLKHTGLKKGKFALESFIDIPIEEAKKQLHFDTEVCSTLEGQIVNIADEIAQRGHDLDDALSSGALTLDEFKKYLTINKADKLYKRLSEGVLSAIDEAKSKGRYFANETEMKNSRVVSEVISYFIKDTIETSQKNMERYCEENDINSADNFGERPFVDEQLISLSESAKPLCRYLETIIGDRVINSSEVALFDSNGAAIVEGLFRAYYNNPRLLHRGTKRRIYIETRRRGIKNIVDLERGNSEAIRKEIELMTSADLTKQDDSVNVEEYKEKRRILVRCICDFISGMTDTYAINEYNRIKT